MRKDVELLDHVVRPDDVAGDLGRVCFSGERSVVFAVFEAVGVETNHVSLVRYVVEPIAFYVRGRTHALQRPIVDASRRELGVDHLPEELAAIGRKRHDHTLVALDARVTQPLVVRPDKDSAIGDRRASIRL